MTKYVGKSDYTGQTDLVGILVLGKIKCMMFQDCMHQNVRKIPFFDNQSTDLGVSIGIDQPFGFREGHLIVVAFLHGSLKLLTVHVVHDYFTDVVEQTTEKRLLLICRTGFLGNNAGGQSSSERMFPEHFFRKTVRLIDLFYRSSDNQTFSVLNPRTTMACDNV